MRVASAVIALLLVALAAPAWAQPPERQVEQGLSEFQDLDFAKAIVTLEVVVSAADASPSQRLLALELIAISHLSLGNEKRAESTFARLLRLRPDYELRNHEGSPKVIGVFERVRKRLQTPPKKPAPPPLPPPPARVATTLRWVSLAQVNAGKRIAFEVSTEGPAPTSMRLWWKRGGDGNYQREPMLRLRDGLWRARIRLAKSSEDYELFLYAQALGPAGEIISGLGNAESPSERSVVGRAVTGKRDDRPWFRSWKVWAGVGAATFLGGAAVVLSSGSDLREGTLSPGRITLSP